MNRLRVFGAVVLTMGLVGGMAPAAFAGDVPSQTPTFTRPVPAPQTCATRPVTFAPTVSPTDEVSTAAYRGHPTPQPTINPQRCSPEQFVAQLTAVGNVVVQNRVIASGPVFGTGSLDLAAQTNTFDRARLPGLFRAVNIRHDGLAFPAVNLALCVASVNQVGLWRFNGGPVFSLFRHAIGNGPYLLTGQWVFPVIGGVCSLRFIRGNPLLQNRIQPRYTSIQVWATGLARI